MIRSIADMDNIKKWLPFIVIGIVVASSLGKWIWLLFLFAAVWLAIKNSNYLLTKNNMANSTFDATPAMSRLASMTKKTLLTILGGIIFVVLAANSIVIIGAGETGVFSLFGKVSDQELASGFHIINPLGKVTRMSVRTQEYTMSIMSNEGQKSGDDSIMALTKEGLNVSLDITTLYRLDEDKASELYRLVGLDYEEKIVRPEIRSTIREIVSQYTAKEIYSEKRDDANQQIKDRLEASLNKRNLILEDVLLRNVALPDNLAKSIQEKLQAEQEAQKYDFILDKEKKEKQRKVIEAEGQRDSQKIVNESLTPNYLYFLYINQLKDRQGTIYVPTSPTTGMPLFRDLGK